MINGGRDSYSSMETIVPLLDPELLRCERVLVLLIFPRSDENDGRPTLEAEVSMRSFFFFLDWNERIATAAGSAYLR